jgi:hypothetical protein
MLRDSPTFKSQFFVLSLALSYTFGKWVFLRVREEHLRRESVEDLNG